MEGLKAQDLRCGNLIYEVMTDNYTGKEYDDLFEVASINSKTNTLIDIEDSITSVDYCKPIQLTEEWLIKFGFDFNDYPDSLSLLILSRGKLNAYNISHDINIEIGTTSGYLFGDTKIKYVHQLQNLYHSLTGKELVMDN